MSRQSLTSSPARGGGAGGGVVYIYALKCPDTLHVRYVGKSINPQKRLCRHLYEAKTGSKTHRHNWINQLTECGKKPLLEILEEVAANQWADRERYYIALYKPTGLLVNATEGGDGLTTEIAKKVWQDPEYRRKQVEAATGANNGFFGRTHTSETRRVLAEKCRHEVPWNAGKKGVYSTEYVERNRLQKHRKPIGRYTKSGELVDTWESARALCRELGWDRRQVQRVLQGAKYFFFIKGYGLRYL
jgi:group I intron endonuclease